MGSPRSQNAGGGSILRFLLIDDDDSVRRLCARLLGAMGFSDVHEARDGIEGLDLARSALPDIVLLDQDMPGMDGLEVLCRLREERGGRRPLVLLVSGRAPPAGVDAEAVLAKPFSPEELERRVLDLVERARRL